MARACRPAGIAAVEKTGYWMNFLDCDRFFVYHYSVEFCNKCGLHNFLDITGRYPIDMIRLTDVVKEYPNGVNALNGLSLEIQDGEFVFMVGPSGSGKSTVIKLLIGEVTPTEGRVMVNGFPVQYPGAPDSPPPPDGWYYLSGFPPDRA